MSHVIQMERDAIQPEILAEDQQQPVVSEQHLDQEQHHNELEDSYVPSGEPVGVRKSGRSTNLPARYNDFVMT